MNFKISCIFVGGLGF